MKTTEAAAEFEDEGISGEFRKCGGRIVFCADGGFRYGVLSQRQIS